MFDTVRLGCDGQDLAVSRLMKSGFVKSTSERIDCEGVTKSRVQFRRFGDGESPSYLAWSPDSGNLVLEQSLPKVLWEHNYRLLSPGDMPKVFETLSEDISKLIGGGVPGVEDWYIRGRADAVFSWDTIWSGTGHQAEYLHAFKSVELPRHFTQAIDREATLYWRNSARLIRLYDKEKETKVKAARGLLRFEVQLRHTKAEVSRLVGLDTIKASDVLTWPVSRALLANYLDGLGADLVISSEENLARTLIDRCGKARGRRLLGFVYLSRLYSREELLTMGFERTMLWRDLREITKAGCSLGSSESGLLPALELPGEDYSGKPLQLEA